MDSEYEKHQLLTVMKIMRVLGVLSALETVGVIILLLCKRSVVHVSIENIVLYFLDLPFVPNLKKK